MSNVNQVCHAMDVLADVKRERRRKNSREMDFDVAVRIYPGLYLDGHITCWIDSARVISDHTVTARDRDGKDCSIDWDDLQPEAQDEIEEKVIEHLNAWSIAS